MNCLRSKPHTQIQFVNSISCGARTICQLTRCLMSILWRGKILKLFHNWFKSYLTKAHKKWLKCTPYIPLYITIYFCTMNCICGFLYHAAHAFTILTYAAQCMTLKCFQTEYIVDDAETLNNLIVQNVHKKSSSTKRESIFMYTYTSIKMCVI